ncbi:unnamed protein product [Paramecium primaurelia]|uniref:Uncharacterized protein n=1 Tax=Paramecium primaurelia TaxID=5886 RepID=A0A8S1MBC6_PARPR|nr:unnamed protein product [Paramecium primaurelia]
MNQNKRLQNIYFIRVQQSERNKIYQFRNNMILLSFRICVKMMERLKYLRSSKGMNDKPALVKEAKNDLDEMLKIIQQMQSIQLLQRQRIHKDNKLYRF